MHHPSMPRYTPQRQTEPRNQGRPHLPNELFNFSSISSSTYRSTVAESELYHRLKPGPTKASNRTEGALRNLFARHFQSRPGARLSLMERARGYPLPDWPRPLCPGEGQFEHLFQILYTREAVPLKMFVFSSSLRPSRAATRLNVFHKVL